MRRQTRDLRTTLITLVTVTTLLGFPHPPPALGQNKLPCLKDLSAPSLMPFELIADRRGDALKRLARLIERTKTARNALPPALYKVLLPKHNVPRFWTADSERAKGYDSDFLDNGILLPNWEDDRQAVEEELARLESLYLAASAQSRSERFEATMASPQIVLPLIATIGNDLGRVEHARVENLPLNIVIRMGQGAFFGYAALAIALVAGTVGRVMIQMVTGFDLISERISYAISHPPLWIAALAGGAILGPYFGRGTSMKEAVVEQMEGALREQIDRRNPHRIFHALIPTATLDYHFVQFYESPDESPQIDVFAVPHL